MDYPPTRTYTRRRFNYDELLRYAMGWECDIHITRHERENTDKGKWQNERRRA